MKLPQTLVSCLGAVALAGMPPLLSAQTQSASTGASADAGEVVNLPAFDVSANTTDPYLATNTTAGTRISGNVIDLAGSVSVLTPEFVQDVNPTRIFDATKYLAGISEGQGDGFYDRQYIRGFQDNRPTVDNFANIETNNVDPLFVDHIEVIKGPSAVLAPSGTPGGQINVINKVPQYTPSRSVTAEVGRIDSQKLSADLTGPLSATSPIAYRFLLGGQDGELNTGGTRERSTSFGAGFTYRISDHTQLTVRGTWEDRWVFVYFPAYFDPALAINGADAVLAPGFHVTGSRNGTESWAHRGGQFSTTDFLLTSAAGDHISLRLAGKYQYMAQRDRDMYGVVPYNLSDRYNPYTGQQTPNDTWALDTTSGKYVPTYTPYYDPTNVIRHPSWQNGDDKDYQLQGDIAAKYGNRDVRSTTVAGMVLDHETNSGTFRTAPNMPINLFAPVYGNGGEPAWGPIIYRFNTNSVGDEEYVNEQLAFWDGRITAMAAFVRASSQGSNNGVEGARTAKTTPQYGVVYKVLPNLSLYGSRSENAVAGYPNGTLLWQDGQQYEFGAKASLLHDRLMVTLAHYQIAQTNLAVANPAFQEDMTQPRQLISDVKEHGNELEVMGELTKHLSLVGSFSLMHQRDSLGRHVLMVPDRMWGLMAKYRFTDGALNGLSLTLGTTYTGRRSGDNPQPAFTVLGVPTQPSFYLPALELWNFGAHYNWNERVSTSLNVDNLFDKKYIALSSGRFLAGVGTPLNVRLSTTLKF